MPQESGQKQGLRNRDGRAERKDRESDFHGRPRVAEFRVERPGDLHHALAHENEKENPEEIGYAHVREKPLEGGKGTCGMNRVLAAFRGEAFRDEEKPVEEVPCADGERREEGEPLGPIAEDAAERGAEDVGETEDGADAPEGFGSLRYGGDVGDVGLGHYDVRAQGAAEDAGNQNGGGGGRERRHERHDAEPENARKKKRPASEAVREGPENRRAEKLRQAVAHHHRAVPKGLFLAAHREHAQKARQHRNDQSDAECVKKYAQKDEKQGGTTGHTKIVSKVDQS